MWRGVACVMEGEVERCGCGGEEGRYEVESFFVLER